MSFHYTISHSAPELINWWEMLYLPVTKLHIRVVFLEQCLVGTLLKENRCLMMEIFRKAFSVSRAWGHTSWCTYKLGSCNGNHDEAQKKCLEMGKSQQGFLKEPLWASHQTVIFRHLKGAWVSNQASQQTLGMFIRRWKVVEREKRKRERLVTAGRKWRK